MNKKYIIGVVVVIVLVGLILIFASNRSASPEPVPTTPNAENNQRSAAPPEATGNIDDAVEAALSDSGSDELPATESDQSLLLENESAISDFGQSFDSATQ